MPLVIVRAADDLSVNGPKTGVKTAIAAAVLACALAGQRRGATVAVETSPAGGVPVTAHPAGDVPAANGLYYAAGLPTIPNVAVAVAWT